MYELPEESGRPSGWYRGARNLVAREWRIYELRALEYATLRDPDLIRAARSSVKWKLAYALSLAVASDEDSEEHAHFQRMAEQLYAGFPEVPWSDADVERFAKWRRWGRSGGRRI